MTIHKTDAGTIIEFTLTDVNGDPVNISDMTTKQILLKKPSGTVLTETAAFVTDGSDGKIQYTTVAGKIDEAGEWKLQAKVSKTGAQFYSDQQSLTVADILA